MHTGPVGKPGWLNILPELVAKHTTNSPRGIGFRSLVLFEWFENQKIMSITTYFLKTLYLELSFTSHCSTYTTLLHVLEYQ